MTEEAYFWLGSLAEQRETERIGVADRVLSATPTEPKVSAHSGDAPLRNALQVLLDHYLSLANSGDAGFWDPEDEDEVKQARAALAAQPEAISWNSTRVWWGPITNFPPRVTEGGNNGPQA